MKKKLLTAFIIGIIAIPTAAFGVEEDDFADFEVTPEDLGIERFYESPNEKKNVPAASTNEPVVRYSFDNQGRHYKELEDGRAPLFKQVRLKINDMLTNRQTQKEEPSYLSEYNKVNRPVSEKLKFWKKQKNSSVSETVQTEDVTDKGVLSESIQEHIDSNVKSTDSLSLETGITEQAVQKELQLDADNVNYDDETGDMVATGRPVLVLPQQGTTVIADKMTYNQDSNIMKAIGNVVVKRNGMDTLADYLEIDLNEETITSENMEAQPNAMKLDAKHAVQKDGLIILTDGNIHSDQSEIHRLSSRMVGPNFSGMILSDEEKALFFGNPEEGNKLVINIRNLKVEARKDHDVFKAKGIEVNKNGHHILSWPSLTAYTNKQRDYFEANYPEFGSRRKLGMFIGPGFVFGGPNGSIIKVIPFLNYKSKFGFGGAIKYRAPFNITELGYGSANDIFFLKGYQRLDDHLFLQYSANSYTDDWFLGARMAKYMVEGYYDKSHTIPNFLGDKMNLTFRHRAGFGLMEDNDRNFYGEKIASNGTTTTRLRYMAEINQSLYSYRNKKNKLYFNLSVALQGSAALYGTGDTQFIARVGPRAHLQYKRWMQDIGYFHSGYDDHSPMPRYDMYRYGKSSVYLSEIFRVNKYLSVGWSGTVTLSDDSPNGKLFQENRFAVAIGPDDLKIRFGYDFVRQTTYFGFDVAFDTKGTTVNYGKMEIKNPERLGKEQKEEKEERKVAFVANKQEEAQTNSAKFGKTKVKQPVLQYAQVINLEDPNKERVD